MAYPTLSEITAVISAVASVGSFAVVSLGVGIAYFQLRSWRKEAIYRRRADVAEHALLTVVRVDEELRYVRSPFVQQTREQAKARGGYLNVLHNRLAKSSPLFSDLEASKAAVSIHIGNANAEVAF